MQSSDESLVPLVINCWPTSTGGSNYEVNVEYELGSQWVLHDVLITIPVPADPPTNIGASAGEAQYSRREGAIVWSIPMIDADNSSATAEFAAGSIPAGRGEAAFFPIRVSFASTCTFCDVDVPAVVSADDESAQQPFTKTAGLAVESYSIE